MSDYQETPYWADKPSKVEVPYELTDEELQQIALSAGVKFKPGFTISDFRVAISAAIAMYNYKKIVYLSK